MLYDASKGYSWFDRRANLLFSFECCRPKLPSLTGDTVYSTCYFLLNVVETDIKEKMTLERLLRTCYFLLNVVLRQ